MLVAFFWFCVRMDWIDRNPALLLKRVKVESKPTDYFTREEFDQLVDATYAYGDWLGGHDFEHRRDRIRALVLLMRWSGIGIKDAVTLERTRIDKEGNLFLYRAKTGVPVYVPLPPFVHGLLSALPNHNPRYFFWSGIGDPETCKRCWIRALARLFKVAQINRPDGTVKRCHSHMLRDTFAVELLLSGVPIDQVSLLLGHSSVKVTERHYAPFVKARQEQLAQSARKAWHFEKTNNSESQVTRHAESGKRPDPTDGYFATFIDQGYCFNAGEWSFPDSPLRGVYARNCVYKTVTSWDAFEPALSRAEQIDIEEIWRIVADIPEEWYESDHPGLNRLIETLYRRRTLIRDLIAAFRCSTRDPFPNWTTN